MKKNLILLLKTLLVFLFVLLIAVVVTYLNHLLYVFYPLAFYVWATLVVIALFAGIFYLVKKYSEE